MQTRSNKPSRPAEWLLKIIVKSKDYDYAIGDLTEICEYMAKEEGEGKARRWLWFEVLRSLPGFVKSSICWRIIMFGSYLKITFRNIKRYKGYSFINIAGLSIGITLFILIISYVRNELSYNRFHTNLKGIYQIGTGDHNGTAVPMAELLKSNFPEIRQIVRFRNNYHSQLFRYKGNFYKIQDIYFVDPEIFDVFTFPVVKGDGETALKEPFSIVLTESEAKRIFSAEDPIGKSINYDNQNDFTVTAVVKDLPLNSSIHFNALFSFNSLDKVTGENVSWGHWSSQTYLLFPEEHEYKAVEEKIRQFLHEMYATQWGMNQQRIEGVAFSLRPMKDLYFDKFRGGRFKHGSLQNVYIFTFIAFIILIIACINFINLTTARASIRANEVGVRKVLGSHRNQLIKQFLSESIIMSFIATVFACIFVELLKPRFHVLIGKKLEIGFFSSAIFILLLIAGAVAIGILSGIYPALYLTSFRPVETLSGKTVKGTKGAAYRKVLTVFQFTMSLVLIIGATTISRQLSFINSRDLGFDKEHLLWFDMSNSIRSKIDVFRDRLLAYPGIEKFATSSFTKPGIISQWDIEKEGREIRCNVFMVDADYIETMGLNIVEGRSFSQEISSDIGRAFILNETAVKELELDSPIGETIRGATLVGVVKDFYFRSLHHEIEPLLLIYNPRACNIVNLRISSGNISETLAYIRGTWEELSPDHPFEYHFLDESFDRLYKAEEKFQKIFFSFSALAIFIACLGLFGLASYMAERRTKEIGIRKVLGASVSEIITLLSKEFTKWVVLANIFAWPISYFAMNKWLQNFAYRINVNLWTFLLAGSFALLIAMLTVSFQAFKAAVANPVDSLRYE